MEKISRNGPCPCGSGRKFKQCCQSYKEAQAANTNYVDPSIPKILKTALEHHQSGRLLQAEAIYQQILRLEPNHSDALHFLGVIAHQTGRSGIAVELISKAIHTNPSSLMYYNLGLAIWALGNLEAAIDSFRKAVMLKPDYVEAYNNLGLVLQALGKLDEADESYHRALMLKPNYVEAHNNMGNVLQAQGKLDEAVAHYHKALALRPDYAEAHYNSGLALRAQNKLDQAIASHQRALQLRATQENKLGFAQCLRYANFTHEAAGIRPLVIRALSEPWGRPSQLVPASISLIKLNRDIKDCIDHAVRAWPARLSGPELFGAAGLAAVAGDALLQCVLESAPASDVALERFLTLARHALLDAAGTAAVGDAVEEKTLAFYCALARQCFITEYVFAYTDAELERAQQLREQLLAALASGSPFPLLWLVAVAAYFPLYSLPSPEALPEQLWPEAVAALLVQQVREPLQERQLRGSIPSLTAVEDEVSRLVQQQYEENPYPRWIKSPPGSKAVTVDAFLRERLPFAPFRPLGRSDGVDILIAGCGTGQHPIQTAQQFSGARVLAVDLSLSSLSYAKRKTRELGLTNIEYAQADIMKLGTTGRTFDVIESVGVLHHLADPLAGWRELVALLRPGGLMKLGFYSELARQGVVAARQFIAAQGYSANAQNIRQCRQELFDLRDDTRFRKLVSASDFYTTSECRDLIFHVQEHRYTLPQLKDAFAELGLDFVGFILQPDVIRRYGERFPDDPAKTNLDCWNMFEAEHPDTFTGMYQFWVQKRGMAYR